jgi:Fe2+ transport system protein FeoA
MPKQNSRPLTNLEKNGKFVVESISDQDPVVLKRLKAQGVTPGTRFQIVSRSDEEFVLRAEKASRILHLSRAHASAVRIRFKD